MSGAPSSVVVHPLVLLSVVDHYNRVAKDTKKRVVGVLLGEKFRNGKVDVKNSFAIPFEENLKKPTVFFLDHNFLENMFAMFKKVNARERIIGWYHSGPKIRESDLLINEIFKNYVKDPILVIIDAKPKDVGLPTEAYYSVEEIKEDGSEPRKTFQHIPSEIGAEEAEEVGVEHLLRDIKDSSVSTLSTEIGAKLAALKGLRERLETMHRYLLNVTSGVLPVNHDIVAEMQDIFNLLPNLNVPEMIRAFAVKANDMLLVVYLSSLIRSVLALHNLINNKVALRAAEKKIDEGDEAEKKKDDKDDKKDKDAKDSKDSKDKKEKSDAAAADPKGKGPAV